MRLCYVKLEFGSLTDQQPTGRHAVRPWCLRFFPRHLPTNARAGQRARPGGCDRLKLATRELDPHVDIGRRAATDGAGGSTRECALTTFVQSTMCLDVLFRHSVRQLVASVAAAIANFAQFSGLDQTAKELVCA